MKNFLFSRKFIWFSIFTLWGMVSYAQTNRHSKPFPHIKLNDTIAYPVPVRNAMSKDGNLKATITGANLTPFQPWGWDDKIVLSTVTGTRTNATSINDHQKVYLDWAIINNGSTDINQAFHIELYIDGFSRVTWTADSLKQNYFLYVSDLPIGPLSAGSHVLRIVVDANNEVPESNENDNEYSITTDIQLSVIPDISITPPAITINQTKSAMVRENSLSKSTNSHVYVPRVPDSLVVKTFVDNNEKRIKVIKVPGSPPPTFRVKAATVSSSAVTLNVPAYEWSFGCSATSAAMIAGYYDNNGYPNIYSGPTNGGVMPMTNSIWGYVRINGETRAQCPLSATRDSVDGRTTRGFVDDYWVKYESSDPDPYITNGWTQHKYADCTGDFMKTGQSAFGITDGTTLFYFGSNGARYTGTNSTDGGYGLEQFFESRGYTVTNRFSQTIVGYNGFTNGFTFDDYVSQIDAGQPVLIHITGHTMVGYGYNTNGDTIYVHDTWDYNNHSMVWGGAYAGKSQFGVTVLDLKSNIPANSFMIYNIGNGSLNISSIASNKEWLTVSGAPNTPFSIASADSQNVAVNINWSLLQNTETGTITISSDDPDEPSSLIFITAEPAPACTTPVAPVVGMITQPDCSVATGSVVLKGLPSGNWTVNPGSVTGSTDSVTISGLTAGTYNFTVTNDGGCSSDSSADVVINAQPVTPSAPVVGTITQPTCSVATGSVVLSGLPSGNWTIDPGNITGSSSSVTISGLSAGTYNFAVTNDARCTSDASAGVVINVQPDTPSAPIVGTITQPTCSVATGSVVLSGLPSGNWTIDPGNITGSSSSVTISGLSAGTYNFAVTNDVGCTSNASAYVAINAQPDTPSAPIVGTITQPTCSLATGSVVLSGLPSGNWTIDPGNITGSSSSFTVSGLSAGTYNFTVTNDAGCISDASADLTIDTQPDTPPTPTISLLNDTTLHSDAYTGNQWYNGTGLLDGATDQNYTAKTSGNYYTIVTLNGCPSDTSNVVAIVISGITFYQNQKTIKIYPNPFTEELVIENKGTTENIAFEILNTNGQVVFKGTFTNTTSISTSRLAPGLYFIKFEKESGVEFQKAIKN